MSNKYILEDRNTECLSAIHTVSVKEYLTLVTGVYEDRGGIEGQRTALKTKTGMRIRSRMVNDICNGTILPPLVIGMVVSDDEFKSAKTIDNDNDMTTFINKINKDKISIIDGMQRTTAIHEASATKDISNNPVRIEIWLSKQIDKLIYRMLVLNTGQVPWDMKRQLETIYKQILDEIKKDVKDIEILLRDDNYRRSSPGQYQGSKLIEYFLAFSSRKVNIDLKEKVAEDFARMDATESTSNSDFLENFKKSLSILARIDIAFNKYKGNANQDSETRFKYGKDIFKSTPASLGLIAAISVIVYGLPGVSYEGVRSQEMMQKITEDMDKFLTKLESLNNMELEAFLDLTTLNEKLNVKTPKVGDFEREFFLNAFKVLIKESEILTSMEPCWAAY